MPWGKLYTFYPAKWMFLSGLVIFEIGSLVCGIAPSSVVLILGRCIAGLGAASLDSGAIIVLTYIVPLSKRYVHELPRKCSWNYRCSGATVGPRPFQQDIDRLKVNYSLAWEVCSLTKFHGDGVSILISLAVLSRSSVFSSCAQQRRNHLHKFDLEGKIKAY